MPQALTTICKLVGLLCMNNSSGIFLRPSTWPSNRLKPVTIGEFVHCVNGVALIPRSLISQMPKCIVQLKGHISKLKLRQLGRGEFLVEQSRLCLRGCPTWRKVFAAGHELLTGGGLSLPPALSYIPWNVPEVFQLHCPGCQSIRVLSESDSFARVDGASYIAPPALLRPLLGAGHGPVGSAVLAVRLMVKYK